MYTDVRLPILFSRGVLRATLITLCFVLPNDLHYTWIYCWTRYCSLLQPSSINIVFGCKQAQQYNRIHHLGFIRAVSWSAQNAKSHWSYVHITLTVEHFSFHAFYKKCGLQRDLMSCSSCVTKTINIFLRYKDDKYFLPIFFKVTNLFNATGHHACSPTPTKISIDILSSATIKFGLKLA